LATHVARDVTHLLLCLLFTAAMNYYNTICCSSVGNNKTYHQFVLQFHPHSYKKYTGIFISINLKTCSFQSIWWETISQWMSVQWCWLNLLTYIYFVSFLKMA
jgi:hypothetical protein